jgi:hypothetical protein
MFLIGKSKVLHNAASNADFSLVECCYDIENCVSSDGGEISSSCEWKSEGCGSTSHAGTWVAGTRFLSLRIGRQSSSGWKYTDEKFNIDKCPGGSTFECCAISAE